MKCEPLDHEFNPADHNKHPFLQKNYFSHDRESTPFLQHSIGNIENHNFKYYFISSLFDYEVKKNAIQEVSHCLRNVYPYLYFLRYFWKQSANSCIKSCMENKDLTKARRMLNRMSRMNNLCHCIFLAVFFFLHTWETFL